MIDAATRVEAARARQTGIDYRRNTFNRQRGLGDVGRQHQATPIGTAQDGPLGVECELAMQDLEVDVVVLDELRDSIRDAPNFADPGQEDEYITVVIILSQQTADRVADAYRQKPLVAIADMLDPHRIRPPFRPDHRATIQVFGDAFGIEGSGHDDQLEIGTHRRLQLAHHGEGDVSLQMALVKFVEDDDADIVEERVVDDLTAENTFSKEPQAGVRSTFVLEAHAVADIATDVLTALARDKLGGGAGCDPSRFEHDDLTCTAEVGIHQRRRYAGRLAGPGCGGHHSGRSPPENGKQVRQNRVDR
jgi:hypothetical protein